MILNKQIDSLSFGWFRGFSEKKTP